MNKAIRRLYECALLFRSSDLWVSRIAKADPVLVGAMPGWSPCGQRIQLWRDLLSQCRKAIAAFNAAYGQNISIREESSVRACSAVIDEGASRTRLILTLGNDVDYIHAHDPVSGSDELLLVVLVDSDSLQFEYRDKLVSSEQASRILLAPILFGVRVHIE